MLNRFAAFILIAAPLTLTAQCVLEVGIVQDLQGPWIDRSVNKRLSKDTRDILCKSSRIERQAGPQVSVDDYLTVAFRGSKLKLLRFECKRLFGCEKPLDLGPLIREAERRLKGSSSLPDDPSAQSKST